MKKGKDKCDPESFNIEDIRRSIDGFMTEQKTNYVISFRLISWISIITILFSLLTVMIL